MSDFVDGFKRWLKPQVWLLKAIFLCWLVLDFKHIFQTVAVMSHASVGAQGSTLILFGQWLPGITNATFDAFAYAFNITALIFLMTGVLARRIVRHQSTWMYVTALVVATLISAFANAGTFFQATTGVFIVPEVFLGPVATTLGTVITGGLLMFSSMDSMDMVHRMHKAQETRMRNLKTRPGFKDGKRVGPHPFQLLTPEERREKFGRKRNAEA